MKESVLWQDKLKSLIQEGRRGDHVTATWAALLDTKDVRIEQLTNAVQLLEKQLTTDPSAPSTNSSLSRNSPVSNGQFNRPASATKDAVSGAMFPFTIQSTTQHHSPPIRLLKSKKKKKEIRKKEKDSNRKPNGAMIPTRKDLAQSGTIGWLF